MRGSMTKQSSFFMLLDCFVVPESSSGQVVPRPRKDDIIRLFGYSYFPKNNQIMKKLALLLITTVFLSSCGLKGEKAAVPDDFDAEEMLANQNYLQNVLNIEMVAKAVGVSVDKIEEYIEGDTRQGGQYTVLYSWPTGKTKTIEEQVEIEEYHSIGLGFLRQMTAEAFENYYGSNAGLQQQVDELATLENLDIDVSELEALYMATYAKQRTVEKLDGVGTMAFWEKPVNALHVLADDAAFTITTNFGTDEALARKNAVKLLDILLNK